MTITEKILAAHCGRKEVKPGELINAKLDLVLANDITAPIAIKEFRAAGAKKVFDPDRIALIPDHFAPNKDIPSAEQCNLLRQFSREHDLSLYFEVGRMGVEHALLPEQGLVVPGDVVIGADSHTCTYGGLGAFSTGVGSTDVAAAMITGEAWFKVPESMKFVYRGKPGKWIGGKDIILRTIGDIGGSLTVDGGGIKAFLSPRAGAVWPTATGSWRASVGRAYRTPSLAERFVTTYALGFRVIPNPALRSEEGWSAEVGRTWTPSSWIRTDAALFFTPAQNLIEPVFVNNATTLAVQFQNVQRARIMGLDLSVTATPLTPHLTTGLAYQLLDARDLALDSALLFRPRHLLTLSGDYDWRAFGVGADFRFSSRFARHDPLFTFRQLKIAPISGHVQCRNKDRKEWDGAVQADGGKESGSKLQQKRRGHYAAPFNAE